MEQGIVKKDDLEKLITGIRGKLKVYGPVKGSNGISISEITPGVDITLSYSNFKLSPKNLFFPQTEIINTYSNNGLAEVCLPEDKFVVWGMRPCDTLALLHLDEVYKKSEPEDPYYLSRRENAIIVSLACTEPRKTCFCTSVGEGPSGKGGTDVLAFDLNNSLLLEACTEKGKELLDICSHLLQEPQEEHLKIKEDQVSAVKEKMQTVDVDRVTEELREKFDSPIWDRISQRCLNCGTCTYSCPTCHCFGIYDESLDSGGRRVRHWDACMFPLFNREASGHNPRETSGQRLKQRIMHKFQYTVENCGEIFCVGCGRCIVNCPVNIDLREIITEVTK